jgi:leucyl/phenylalanyl-tRNA---protein transferase
MATVDIVGISRTLTAPAVEQAYARGLFPMAAPEEGIITWHFPDPRAIIPLDRFHLPRRLARTIRSRVFEVTFDRAFAEVMIRCAEGRPVWISDEFRRVYGEVHRRRRAHSVEVWHEGHLAGGLYGVHLGGAFFAESMFHRVRDASKVALAALVDQLRARAFVLLEVQYLTEHLERFGATTVPAASYLRLLRRALARDCIFLE